MATTTHKVVKGDTLSEIAAKYKGEYGYSSTADYQSALVKHNDIDNPNLIYVGQVIKLDVKNTASKTTTKKNTSNKPVIKLFGLQADTDRTVFATWTWDKTNTQNYKTMWYYSTGDGVWFVGNDGTTDYKQSTYNAPSNATKVKFKVKAVSKKHTVNGKETDYWTGDWSTEKTYKFSDNPPTKPNAPDVEIKNLKLTAKYENLDINATDVEFQVVKNDKSTFKKGTATIKYKAVSFACDVTAGADYKVRARGKKGDTYGDWSEFSSNAGTPPAAPSKWNKVEAKSKTEVQLDWANVKNATGYEVQYTTKQRYFDSGSDVQSHTVDGSVVGHAEITGLQPGETWHFRVRATNEHGESPWLKITSIKLGEKPSAPTTWSSTTTATVGGPLNLYWAHNSVDGSSQTYANLEITIGGKTTTHNIKNSTEEDKKDKTSVYAVNTSSYTEGTEIKWRVQTRGITNEYSDWSVQRTIKVYAPPTLELEITNQNGDSVETIESFPFVISGLTGPNTQKPISYHVNIAAKQSYETVDNVGNEIVVSAGESVYSTSIDTDDALMLYMSAGAINLENNVTYIVTVTASMDSGLTAEDSIEFNVAWMDLEYEPNAEIGIDRETLTANIRAYCEDENGELIEGITLAVYRREFDGTFTKLATGLINTNNTFITDPHPALDFARYRVVAITDATGAVSYYDVPGYPVGETAVIIQWEEEWSSFDTTNEDALAEPEWSGSMLKLPYNIDVTDNINPDKEMIEYIGRKQPVSYYGTHLGESATWNVAIDKADKETLYALRRLRTYMGDVYVREPSGSGYWASITVSFSQKHRDLIIPVTINITRVAGGA